MAENDKKKGKQDVQISGMGRHPMTIVLGIKTYKRLLEIAEADGRKPAAMVRRIVEQAID